MASDRPGDIQPGFGGLGEMTGPLGVCVPAEELARRIIVGPATAISPWATAQQKQACLDRPSTAKTSSPNPKDLIGITKVPVGLFPSAGTILGAMSMKDGAVKYGPYNWREHPVKMTVYLDAMERHLLALRDGEDEASDSGVHHLGHILGCAAILADALAVGNLIDDRPHKGAAAALFEKFREKKKEAA